MDKEIQILSLVWRIIVLLFLVWIVIWSIRSTAIIKGLMVSIKVFANWIENFENRYISQDSKIAEIQKAIVDLYSKLVDRHSDKHIDKSKPKQDEPKDGEY